MNKLLCSIFDSYFDGNDMKWLEESCGDEACEFCENRPKEPCKNCTYLEGCAENK